MLLVKKFTKIKKLFWYRFLYDIRINTNQNIHYIKNDIKNYVDNFERYEERYIRNVIIKSSIFDYKDDSLEYCIRKEIVTNTLILTCDDLIDLHIDKYDIEKYLYNKH